jgi:hypothetical protein
MSGMERPIRVEVDGEVFDVVARRDHPGQYDHEWTSVAELRLRLLFGVIRRSSVNHGGPRGSDPELRVTTRPEYGLHGVEHTDMPRIVTSHRCVDDL